METVTPTAAARSKRMLCVMLFDIVTGMVLLIRTIMTVIRVLVQGERSDSLYVSYPAPNAEKILFVLALLAMGLYLSASGWHFRQYTPTRARLALGVHASGFVAVLVGLFLFPQTFSFNTPLPATTALALALGAGCFAMGFLCFDLLRHPPEPAATGGAERAATVADTPAAPPSPAWSPAPTPGRQATHPHREPHPRPAKIRGAGLAIFNLIMGGLAMLFFSGTLLNEYAHDQRMRDEGMEQYVALNAGELLFYAALLVGSLGLIGAGVAILRRAPRAHGWAALANWFFLILLTWPFFRDGYWMVLAFAPVVALIHFAVVAVFLGFGIRALLLLRKPKPARSIRRERLKEEIEVAPGWDEATGPKLSPPEKEPPPPSEDV